MISYFCEYAMLPQGLAHRVRLSVGQGRFTRIESNVDRKPGDEHLPGVALPGFANVHSHAFHRALRGRTHQGTGTFWTWRRAMYDMAERLDPDTYLAMATAVYREAAMAGYTVIGEFHYVHHGPGGQRYENPNAMGEALREAARRVGVRLTLLDTCYLAAGIADNGSAEPLEGVQLRFGDADAHDWAQRVAALKPDSNTVIGAAVHSVRAVPADQLSVVAAVSYGRPLHVHLSEQRAENAACLAAHALTPTGLLAENGVLSPLTTAVHATHLTMDDIGALARSGTGVCMCPTTERDLADGIGPARALADAGVKLSLGSDQHAVLDGPEEARAMEMNERLASGERGRFQPAELLAALTVNGYRALGWPDGGRLEIGALADVAAIGLDSVRTAGSYPEQVLYSASASDIHTVIVGGVPIVRGGRHVGHVGDTRGGAK